MWQLPRLRCTRCRNAFEIQRKTPWCDCGNTLELDHPVGRLTIDESDFSFWRYQGVLPVKARVSLGEPITPIVPLNLGERCVDAKLEYVLPTGSFKDRGAAVLV